MTNTISFLSELMVYFFAVHQAYVATTVTDGTISTACVCLKESIKN